MPPYTPKNVAPFNPKIEKIRAFHGLAPLNPLNPQKLNPLLPIFYIRREVKEGCSNNCNCNDGINTICCFSESVVFLNDSEVFIRRIMCITSYSWQKAGSMTVLCRSQYLPEDLGPCLF